jgi:hypothetical protein
MTHMDDSQERIAKLSERFKTHSTGRPRQTTKERERRSFYLDTALMDRLNNEYKAFNHSVYPTTVSKSIFLETLLEHSLKQLADIKPEIIKAASEEKAA